MEIEVLENFWAGCVLLNNLIIFGGALLNNLATMSRTFNIKNTVNLFWVNNLDILHHYDIVESLIVAKLDFEYSEHLSYQALWMVLKMFVIVEKAFLKDL